MRYTAVIFFGLLIFFGCGKPATVSTVTTITDSTVTREVVRFDTLVINGDTVRLVDRIECDSVTNKPKPFRSRARSGRAALSVVVSASGELQTEAICDSLQRVIELRDKEISRLRLEKTAITKVITPSKWQVWFDTTCKILAALFVVVVALRFAKVV